jgi:hypothetical protein
MAELLKPREIDFLLYEFLDTSSLPARPRYAGQSKEDTRSSGYPF